MLKDLLNPKALDKCSKKSEFISHLSKLHSYLSNLEQDCSKPIGLDAVASQLVSNRVLCNDDKEVRLIAVCCIVDMLRLFAPNAPFSQPEFKIVFEILINQLRGLGAYEMNSGFGVKIVYIIVSLATVKSGLVLVELAQHGSLDLLESLFSVLLSCIRPHHDEECKYTDKVLLLLFANCLCVVLLHIESILESCLNECNTNLISHDILESLLLPILPANKIENPKACSLAQAVLRRSFSSIRNPLTSYLNNLMASSMSDNKDAIVGNTNMEILNAHLYPLLYELQQIMPQLLIGVIPNLCMQLQAEEVEIRLKGVQVLGTLLSTESVNNNPDMARYIKEYLSRFGDISPQVRISMIDQASIFMKNKPEMLSEVEGKLNYIMRVLHLIHGACYDVNLFS